MELFSRIVLLLIVAAGSVALYSAQTFRVATFNVENYIAGPSETRPLKTPAAKQKVRESLRALHADVLALQEIGETNALFELRQNLAREGLDYPYWEWVNGFDTNVHVAVLSRFAIAARRSHSRESFLLHGRRMFVSRGFAEVDIRPNPRYQFTMIVAHLKSKRPTAQADESEIRQEEALVLRDLIDRRLQANPNANLIVLGDLNDYPTARPIRTLIGRGRNVLIDTRPAEQNGDNARGASGRRITWTHHFAKEDTYSRLDYILISRAMAREWDEPGSFVFASPNWGLASDHRPILAQFRAQDE